MLRALVFSGKEEKVELDVAVLIANAVVPKIEERIDAVYKEVLNLFKQGKLTQEKVITLTADMHANRRLLTWIEYQAGGKNG